MVKMNNNIDEIIKTIEKKMVDLENKKHEKDNITDLDEIIKEIDKKIDELEIEEKEKRIDIDLLNKKINNKLKESKEYSDDDLDRTIYDLSEIAKTVDKTIKQLEAKKKDKKRKKAMYCDMARRQQNKKKNK